MNNRLAMNLPFDALVRAGGFGPEETDTIAAATGFSARSVHRWKRVGLTRASADRAAVSMGTHPASVWVGEWDS